MSESLISRNVVVGGQRTSFRLEPEMWSALQHICEQEETDIHTLCTWISDHMPRPNRTSAIRAFIVSYLRAIIDDISFSAEHDDAAFCAEHQMSEKICYVLKKA